MPTPGYQLLNVTHIERSSLYLNRAISCFLLGILSSLNDTLLILIFQSIHSMDQMYSRVQLGKSCTFFLIGIFCKF